MSLSDLAALGSFVSGFAVLASLIYLALQTRQNVKHKRVSAARKAALFILCRLRRNSFLREIVDQPLWIANVDVRRFVLDNFATGLG